MESWEGYSHSNSRVTLPQAEGTGTLRNLRRRLQRQGSWSGWREGERMVQREVEEKPDLAGPGYMICVYHTGLIN